MKITFVDQENDFPKILLEVSENQIIELIASDFLAACIASMGLKYEAILAEANAIVADGLYGQNFPDCCSEPYPNGEELQESLTELNKFLLDSQDKRLSNLDPTVLNPAARPIGTGGIRTNVTILPATKEKAREIGNGNVSAGIDIAVESYPQRQD